MQPQCYTYHRHSQGPLKLQPHASSSVLPSQESAPCSQLLPANNLPQKTTSAHIRHTARSPTPSSHPPPLQCICCSVQANPEQPQATKLKNLFAKKGFLYIQTNHCPNCRTENLQAKKPSKAQRGTSRHPRSTHSRSIARCNTTKP